MRKFARFALLAATAATVTVGVCAPAFADPYGRHYHDDAAAMGLFGLAAGVVAGAAIADSQPRYIDPPPPPAAYYPAQPGYVVEYRPVAAPLRPWSPEWYDYCSQRYRSFSPRNGTYIGYDGRAHFCAP